MFGCSGAFRFSMVKSSFETIMKSYCSRRSTIRKPSLDRISYRCKERNLEMNGMSWNTSREGKHRFNKGICPQISRSIELYEGIIQRIWRAIPSLTLGNRREGFVLRWRELRFRTLIISRRRMTKKIIISIHRRRRSSLHQGELTSHLQRFMINLRKLIFEGSNWTKN